MIEPMAPQVWNDHGGAIFNGDHHVLYWADASSEIAFVVPSNRPRPATAKFGDDSSLDGACPTGAGGGSAAPPESAKRRFQRQPSTAQQVEVKMVIFWLERMEDSADIPLDNILAETMTGTEVGGGFAPSQKDTFAVFIQPMKSGLMMIRMQGQTAK